MMIDIFLFGVNVHAVDLPKRGHEASGAPVFPHLFCGFHSAPNTGHRAYFMLQKKKRLQWTRVNKKSWNLLLLWVRPGSGDA